VIGTTAKINLTLDLEAAELPEIDAGGGIFVVGTCGEGGFEFVIGQRNHIGRFSAGREVEYRRFCYLTFCRRTKRLGDADLSFTRTSTVCDDIWYGNTVLVC